jgi:hypothetical protein
MGNVPGTSLAVNQDCSTWSSLFGSATVTTGVVDPFGGTTAATLTAASGSADRGVLDTSMSLSVGDYFIFGVWIKSEDATVLPSQGGNFGITGTGNILDSSQSYTRVSTEMTDQYGSSKWMFLSKVTKITALATNPAGVRLYLGTDSTHPTSYWKPFIIRLPASLNLTEAEVYRIKRQIGNVVAGLPAGSVGMFPEQTFYMGRTVHQVTTTFTNADTTPSVAAGNLFKTNNSGATSITTFDDGVDGLSIVIVATDANTTFVNGATIKNRSGANVTTAANLTYTYLRIGGVWYQQN